MMAQIFSLFFSLFLALFLDLCCLGFINSPPAWAFNTVKFYDGDNITIMHNGLKAQVHLACIDAPELKQAKGQAARKALKALMDNQPYELNIIGRDRIGRFVAEINNDRGNVNKLLVSQGFAEFYNPSGKDCEGYSAAQKSAQNQNLGIWAKGAKSKSPQEFRKSTYQF